MKRKLTLKQKVLASGAALVAVAGGGSAIAATQLGSNDSQAVIEDAAQRLGVKPQELSNALEQALLDRIDAQVAAGQIPKTVGDELKARIQAGDFPLFGGFGHRFGHFGRPLVELDAAASYLDLTVDQLRSRLDSGKTLAQVAGDVGKSVDGLVQALTDAEKKQLDEAVAAGRLTKEQEQEILSELPQRITDLVNGVHRGWHEEGERRFSGSTA
jgi:hypothetical protein